MLTERGWSEVREEKAPLLMTGIVMITSKEREMKEVIWLEYRGILGKT